MYSDLRAICSKCLKSILIDPTLVDSSMSKYLPIESGTLKRIASTLDLNSLDHDPNEFITTPELDNNNFSSPKGTLGRSYSIVGEKQQLKAKAKFFFSLFQGATNASHIDHPLCVDCNKKEMQYLDESIQNLLFQHSSYISYLDNLKKEEENSDEKKYIEMLNMLDEEEKLLEEEIRNCKKERRWIKDQTNKCKNENKKIEILFSKFNKNRNEYIFKENQCQEQIEMWKQKIINVDLKIEKLNKTNTFNDAFFIWYDGHFGTINSFRLGRLPSQPVDWNEINAAWGHATKLLASISTFIKFEFADWIPMPNGSTSTMYKLDDKSHYELYGSSDISLGRLFWYRRFDKAMVAFLDCVNQLINFATSKDTSFGKKIPYLIVEDKIGRDPFMMTIKSQFTDEEVWTKALKYMLTNLKFLIAWVSKNYEKNEEEEKEIFTVETTTEIEDNTESDLQN